MMPTPTTFTVASTAVYRSADGNDARQFFAGDVIDYTDAIHFQMVAAPAALPPIVGGLRLDPSNFAVDADGVVTVTGAPAGNGTLAYALVTETARMGQLTSNGAAETEFAAWNGTPELVATLDLTGMTQVRLIAQVISGGPAGAIAKVKYSLDDTTYAELKTGGLSIAIDAAGWANTDWQSLVAGAQAPVFLRLYTKDCATTAMVAPLIVQFK